MNTLKFCAGVITLILVLGFVGQEDAVDATEQQAFYCKQVKDHAWPDFKNNFEKECTK